MKKIKIYNTLSRSKENFNPITPDQVKMYGCGVTTYDDCHLGHALQAIFFDVIRNYLILKGFDVTYVRNYTDVNDKINHRAQELGCSPKDLAEKMVDSCKEDLANLKVKPATYEPKVSDSIPEIISMIEDLVRKEHAYVTKEGDVYYRVHKNPSYGKLSNQNIEEIKSGTREIAEGDKEEDCDFALWKADDTKDATWESPWGRGAPGWHIECSAMSKKYLGPTFDLHGGGRDLVFPHHENEIAQSESANGCGFANIWMHSGLLTINQQKMSKSLGNFITVKDFLAQWPAEVLRLSFLLNHYRSNIDFSEDLFKQCRRRLLYYYETLHQLREIADMTKDQTLNHQVVLEAKDEFIKAMDDDFNTPEAFASINKFMKKCNQYILSKKLQDRVSFCSDALALIQEWSQLFAIFEENSKNFIRTLKLNVLAEFGMEENEVESLIKQRLKARQNKDWKESDRIRDQLLEKGVTLMDEPNGGTSWTIKRSDS